MHTDHLGVQIALTALQLSKDKHGSLYKAFLQLIHSMTENVCGSTTATIYRIVRMLQESHRQDVEEF
jgi:hypothetical protein